MILFFLILKTLNANIGEPETNESNQTLTEYDKRMSKTVKILFGTIYGALGILLFISISHNCCRPEEYDIPQEIIFPESNNNQRATNVNTSTENNTNQNINSDINDINTVNPYENPYSRPYASTDDDIENID